MTIDIDNDRYMMTQSVTERYGSYYDNVLQIMDAVSLAGNHRFTCSISNLAGSTSKDIFTTLQGMRHNQHHNCNITVWTEIQ